MQRERGDWQLFKNPVALEEGRCRIAAFEEAAAQTIVERCGKQGLICAAKGWEKYDDQPKG